MNKLISKEYKKTEFQVVNEFVIKKLKVRDLFKVRDRFEGNQYLINTTTKYMLFYTLFEYLGLDLRDKFKIGFINTINLEEFFGIPIKIIETKEELKSCLGDNNHFFAIVNIDRKLCEIYGTHEMKNHILDSVSVSIEKYGKIILL